MPPSRPRRTFSAVVIVLSTSALGLAIGVGFAAALGLYARRQDPDDPSAGSAADIVIAAAPLGLFAGFLADSLIAIRLLKKF